MATTFDTKALEAEIIQALKMVYDPEIPVNIYDLGLIYEIKITPPGHIDIQMTLTAPNCPEAQNIPTMVEAAVRSVECVVDVKVELVWEPSWTKDKMSEEARLVLGMF